MKRRSRIKICDKKPVPGDAVTLRHGTSLYLCINDTYANVDGLARTVWEPTLATVIAVRSHSTQGELALIMVSEVGLYWVYIFSLRVVVR